MNPTGPQRPDDDRGHDHGSEDTQAVETNDPTRALQKTPTTEYAVTRGTQVGDPGDNDPDGGRATAYPAQSEPVRPTGTSWATVTLGLVALLVGALVFGVQIIDFDVDWSVATPAVFVGAGGVLVVLGLVALAQRRSQQETG